MYAVCECITLISALLSPSCVYGFLGNDGLQPETRERTSSVSDEYLRFLSKPGHIEKRFPVDRKKQEMDFPRGFHSELSHYGNQTSWRKDQVVTVRDKEINSKKWERLRI